jgi:hypothetical protein
VKGERESQQIIKPLPQFRTSQGTWVRIKVEKAYSYAFAEHLAQDFQSHYSENESEEEETLIKPLETLYQLE